MVNMAKLSALNTQKAHRRLAGAIPTYMLVVPAGESDTVENYSLFHCAFRGIYEDDQQIMEPVIKLTKLCFCYLYPVHSTKHGEVRELHKTIKTEPQPDLSQDALSGHEIQPSVIRIPHHYGWVNTDRQTQAKCINSEINSKSCTYCSVFFPFSFTWKCLWETISTWFLFRFVWRCNKVPWNGMQ